MTDPVVLPAQTTAQLELQMALAAVAALSPIAGPQGEAISALIAQGIGYWASVHARAAAGELSLADVEALAGQTAGHLSQYEADLAAQQQGVQT